MGVVFHPVPIDLSIFVNVSLTNGGVAVRTVQLVLRGHPDLLELEFRPTSCTLNLLSH